MFRSFIYHPITCYYTIEDDDFVEHMLILAKDAAVYTAVIRVYERRNLPVVPNLLRVLLYMQSQYGGTLKRLPDFLATARNEPAFWQYADEVEQAVIKCLLLA